MYAPACDIPKVGKPLLTKQMAPFSKQMYQNLKPRIVCGVFGLLMLAKSQKTDASEA
jgi:hypothetical protein